MAISMLCEAHMFKCWAPTDPEGVIISTMLDVPHSIKMLCCICMIIHVSYEIQMLIVPSLVKECPGVVEPEDPSWCSQKLAIDTSPGNIVMLCSHLCIGLPSGLFFLFLFPQTWHMFCLLCLHLIMLMVLVEEWVLQSSLLCDFLLDTVLTHHQSLFFTWNERFIEIQ